MTTPGSRYILQPGQHRPGAVLLEKGNTMKYYTILSEHIDAYGEMVTINTILSEEDVGQLSVEFERSEEELIQNDLARIMPSEMSAVQLLAVNDTYDYYDADICREICNRAGLRDKWDAADGEQFEGILDKAIAILEERENNAK